LPALVLRPTDKQTVERTFGAIRSLLFEALPGYTGVDVYDRDADPEADATFTVEAMASLIATWTVGVWQNRRLGEHSPAWDPGGVHSPEHAVRRGDEPGRVRDADLSLVSGKQLSECTQTSYGLTCVASW
jgi:hypothetical protein